MLTRGNWRGKVYKKKMKKNYREDEWLKIKRECLRRYKFTCYRCDKTNSQGREMTAHHIIPRSEGGTMEQSNLVALCNPCHDIVEVSNARSLVDILATYDAGTRVIQIKDFTDREASFKRPPWHRWVYGDHRREPSE